LLSSFGGATYLIFFDLVSTHFIIHRPRTANQTMTDEIKWSISDAERLQQLRRQAGLTVPDLAKMSGISEAQIAQLEGDGDSLFYSSRIKFTVGKRLTLQLIEQSQLKSSSILNPRSQIPSPYKDAHHALQAIEEMSQRNLDASPLTDFYWRARVELVRLMQSKYVLASLAMMVVMISVSVIETSPSDGGQVQETHPSQLLALTRSIIVPVFQINDWAQAQWGSWFSQRNDALHETREQKTANSLSRDQGSAAHLAGMADLAPLSMNSSTDITASLQDGANSIKTLPIQAQECQFNPQGGTEVFSTSTYRPATYVYLVAKKETTVCIQDGQHVMSQVKLALGGSQSVYGSPPWHLRLQDLDAVDVFFQGHRILLPPSDDPQFTLIQFAQDNHH
jgi:transcriptional regulator with XRE-family HTH domain